MKSVGELITDLFATHKHPTGREYTQQEIAQLSKGKLEFTHVGKLKAGKIPNPGLTTLQALCQVFSVEPEYFFPELADVHYYRDAEAEQYINHLRLLQQLAKQQMAMLQTLASMQQRLTYIPDDLCVEEAKLMDLFRQNQLCLEALAAILHYPAARKTV